MYIYRDIHHSSQYINTQSNIGTIHKTIQI